MTKEERFIETRATAKEREGSTCPLYTDKQIAKRSITASVSRGVPSRDKAPQAPTSKRKRSPFESSSSDSPPPRRAIKPIPRRRAGEIDNTAVRRGARKASETSASRSQRTSAHPSARAEEPLFLPGASDEEDYWEEGSPSYARSKAMEKSSSVKPTPEKPRTSYTATSHEAEPLFLPGPSDEEDERGAAQSASKASEKPTATKATREKPRTSGAANSHISEPLFLPGVSDKESDTGTGSAAGAAGRGNVSGLSARKPAKETPIGEKQIEPRHEDSINEEPSSQIPIPHAEEPLPGEEEAWYPHALDEFVLPTLPAGDGSSGQDTSPHGGPRSTRCWHGSTPLTAPV